MLQEYLTSTSILDLPPEIIVKIVRKLPYTDIESARLTCWAFNDAGGYVQKTALRKMRTKADAALRRCHTGIRDVNEARALRALKGTASVKCLSGMLRVADASTFHLLQDGVLPPAPAALLVDVEKALNIAARKNPLVGRDRLKRIFSGFKKYLTTTMNSLDLSLKTISVYRSSVDLISSLPFETCNIAQTSYGLHCLIHLNLLTVMVNRSEYSLTGPLLIQFLAKLNFKGIEEFINITMGSLFREEIQSVEATIDWIELVIVCSPEESVGVNCLKQVCQLEPTDFQVRLHGVSYFRPPDQFNVLSNRNFIRGRALYEGEEIATYIYSSLPLEEFNFLRLNNSFSNAV